MLYAIHKRITMLLRSGKSEYSPELPQLILDEVVPENINLRLIILSLFGDKQLADFALCSARNPQLVKAGGEVGHPDIDLVGIAR